MTLHAPLEMSGTAWPHLRHDVRQFAQSCPTCQKMNTRHKTIRASRFVLSTLKPMERISIDTIGPLPADIGMKYIIVIIDTFTRYVELFPKQEVTAIAAADVLWRRTCRFTAPPESSPFFTVRQRLTVTLSPRDGYRTPYLIRIVLQGREWH